MLIAITRPQEEEWEIFRPLYFGGGCGSGFRASGLGLRISGFNGFDSHSHTRQARLWDLCREESNMWSPVPHPEPALSGLA